jgi:thiol-disulfide isomerase/thioredoxin
MKRLQGIVFTALAIVAVAVPLIWVFVSNYRQEQAENSLHASDIMILKDLNGNPIELSRYKGKVVFINFWATWCAPCIAEMPSIQKASEQLPSNKVEFLLASNEPVDRITSFKERRNIALQFVRLENQEELGIQVLPTTYIVNSAGKLVFSEAGSRQWDSPENIEMLNKIINDND